MFKAPKSDFLVPFDGTFRIADAATKPEAKQKWNHKKRLRKSIKKLDVLQKALYASDRHALLSIFQGMDAAGKDSTVRAVMEGINPAGCQVYSFKKPSSIELDHDFLSRTSRALPERGRIGIFNRSQYEEVLVVRVHPETLNGQQLPGTENRETIWEDRYESIRDQEKHLARNGTMIVKFWLNVSKDEQKERFLDRLNTEEKQWKFNPGDIKERGFWDDYMRAFEDALNATSRSWAPWYAIPADNKPYMRACVAEIIVAALSGIGLKYPQPSAEDRAQFDASREALSGPTGK
ncbi:MAG: polyphosphate kinase 2 family protein [Gammaproteobacteria bacterium]|nr:MAG: polyphosphate kinase 2 family protein [Gammaproteobacteria bacterium]